MKKLQLPLCIALLAITAMSGCKSINPDGQSETARLFGKEPTPEELAEAQFGTPESVAAIWSDTVSHGNGDNPMRGFGGRVFLTDFEGRPVKARGSLFVYGFDEQQQKDEAQKKFVFRASELQNHYSESDLGHSYSFWCPWDETGGPERSIALIPVFQMEDGSTIRGDQSIVVLRGKRPEQVADNSGTNAPGPEKRSDTGLVRQAAFLSSDPSSQVVTASDQQPVERPRTTTIDIPRHLARRIGESANLDARLASSESNRVRVYQETLPNEAEDMVTGQPTVDRSTSYEERRKRLSESQFGKPGDR